MVVLFIELRLVSDLGEEYRQDSESHSHLTLTAVKNPFIITPVRCHSPHP